MPGTLVNQLGVISQVQAILIRFYKNPRDPEKLIARHPVNGKAIFPHKGWENVVGDKDYHVLLLQPKSTQVYFAIPSPLVHTDELYMGLDSDAEDEDDEEPAAGS